MQMRVACPALINKRRFSFRKVYKYNFLLRLKNLNLKYTGALNYKQSNKVAVEMSR